MAHTRQSKSAQKVAEAMGARHKKARTEVLGMTVSEYSAHMRVSAVSVYAWENGTRTIPLEVMRTLELEHNISTSWLHNGTEPMLLQRVGKDDATLSRRIADNALTPELPQISDDAPAWKKLEIIHDYLQQAGSAIASLTREVLVLNPLRQHTTRFPLMASSVSAGSPVSTSDDTVTVDIVDFLVSNPDHTFFVNVVGDSMKDIGIYDGDTLIIDRSIVPKSGEIIVARVFNELTVKRFVRNGKRVILAAENKAHKNIEVTEDMDFSIIGVVTTSIKKFRR